MRHDMQHLVIVSLRFICGLFMIFREFPIRHVMKLTTCYRLENLSLTYTSNISCNLLFMIIGFVLGVSGDSTVIH